ncbi:Hypothetical protein KFL_001410100 [Klebsormidium nitens]|uniref:RING-type domain-containing protein n=1 Tax=Klebsormidium nitens TaxID=105231 RepID=A0A0U9HUY2_KLENI|nr:Hypothetical protein KFL_001410100 [Klebsormidium nitens]|eukprot:GAQ83252.1 Hypothetical protein KFL_001410100 [Klebsormidium nitens]
MEGSAKGTCPQNEQRHGEPGPVVAGMGQAAACDRGAASHGFESYQGEPSPNIENDSQSYHSAEETLLAAEPEQSTGTNAPMALEHASTAGVEQTSYPGSQLETSSGNDSGLPSAGSSEDDNLPALLGPEAFSESEDEDDEPPGLVGESESDMDSDVDSEMESLPALGSDMSDSDSFADASPSAEAGHGGQQEGLTASAASGRSNLHRSPSERPATEDQDWDELPDLLDAESDDEEDSSTHSTHGPVFSPDFHPSGAVSALRSAAVSLRTLLSTGFQPGTAAAPTAGGGREARRRERRRRVARVAEPAENEDGGHRRRSRRLSPANRASNDERSAGGTLFLPLGPMRAAVSTARAPRAGLATQRGGRGSPSGGVERDDDDVPDLLSAEDEDDETDEEDEGEEDDDDDDLPPLLNSDGEEDEYADMPDLLPDSASSGSDHDEDDEEDGERTPRPARAARRGGLFPPGGLAFYGGPTNFGAGVQMAVQFGGIPPFGIDFARNRLLAFRAGDFVLDENLDQVMAMLGAGAHPQWPPPASRAAVQALEKVTMPEEPGEESCSVCRSVLEARIEVLRMPCRHLFHADCLHPWLDVRNSCPLCRLQLPTDDPDYESMRQQGVATGGSGDD